MRVKNKHSCGCPASQAAYDQPTNPALARTEISLFWRGNDGGYCVRIPTDDVESLKFPEYCSLETRYDEILLYQLDQFINQLTTDSLIILHQTGSHDPTDYQRPLDINALCKTVR